MKFQEMKYRVAHECVNSKAKHATPNWKDIEIYFANFNLYKFNMYKFPITFQNKFSFFKSQCTLHHDLKK